MNLTSKPTERRNFSRIQKVIDIPDLIEVQRDSYVDFLQAEYTPDNREVRGLEEVFREIFPITDFNETAILEYISYSIEKFKYTPSEAIDRSTTFAAPLKIKVRLVTYDVSEETGEKMVVSAKESEVYLCDIPMMTDRGTFVINGVERVIVSQLHRSPGIFFEDLTASKGIMEKHLFSARIIPYRGSWIDFDFDSKNIMYVRIDKKRKIPVTVLLKALGYTEREILDTYYTKEQISIDSSDKIYKNFNEDIILGVRNSLDILDAEGNIVVKANHKITKAAKKRLIKAEVKKIPIAFEDIEHTFFAEDVVTSDGEVLIETNTPVTEEMFEKLQEQNIKEFEVLFIDRLTSDSIMRDILTVDKVKTQEEALIDIYKKLRPGEPATEDTAKTLFDNLFFNPKRYDLSKVGRLKINKRLGLDVALETTTLTKEDIVETVRVLENIRKSQDKVDDIDHLGHRRVRAAGEQLQNHIRIGLSRMEKTVKERMSIQDLEDLTPQDLLNAKPLSASIKEFFGSYQLSQFMDQTNPLSEITHKRRLSALGPGGLNRDRAGFEVRDVHTSHYGRICPIETPEGPNIGLITSLTTFAKVNEFGFIETPYRKVKDCVVSKEVVYMSAIEEEDYYIAQANAPLNEDGTFIRDFVAARYDGEPLQTSKESISYMDISPKQMVSVSAALIPFLEHDDANRALMGSNMQRQGVPLVRTDSPIVGTGMEKKVAVDSGAVITAKRPGVVEYIDSAKVAIRYKDGEDFGLDVYDLVKYRRSNQDTCINYKPIVRPGETVIKGSMLAGGPATDNGELALGQNMTLAFMPWMGYNYEDSILISERVVREDRYTSIHIEEFEIEARDTKLGPEEITGDIPNVSDEALKDLDESGIIRIGARVKPRDILVGKVTPKGETQATPEEKLLRAIFGEKAGDVKDASLRVPPSITGTVVDVQVMTRRGIEKDSRTEIIERDEHLHIQKDYERELKALEKSRNDMLSDFLIGKKLKNAYSNNEIEIAKGTELTTELLSSLLYTDLIQVEVDKQNEFEAYIQEINGKYFEKVNAAEEYYKDKKRKVEKGDELPAGVLKSVKVYVAIKRKLSVGDKMAGRHGNKGVISRILPAEDMPYLPDGTPVDVVMNPLAVPSRMNVGQVLEVHLGWAAKALGIKVATEVFDGARESDIKELLVKAGFQEDGQTILYDGRTGDRFEQEVTVGVMYILKLHHLVDTKLHARSTGPYSLVTQQPLGGKAQFGGQRLGEMEVWALEAYGAANVLQEMLTVKSDDVEGRTTVYEAIVNGNFSFTPSMPESFNVLIKELQGLALDMELLTSNEDGVLLMPEDINADANREDS